MNIGVKIKKIRMSIVFIFSKFCKKQLKFFKLRKKPMKKIINITIGVIGKKKCTKVITILAVM